MARCFCVCCWQVKIIYWLTKFIFKLKKNWILLRKFENVYVGWGHKYSVDNLNPQLPPLPQEEFVSGPEITEEDDPSPQDEAADQKAKNEAEEQELEGEEEQQPEDEGEEDD